MASESSFSQGLGIGCGIYTAFVLIALAVPTIGMFFLCGGCAIITGGAATVATTGAAVEAGRATQEAATLPVREEISIPTRETVDAPELVGIDPLPMTEEEVRRPEDNPRKEPSIEPTPLPLTNFGRKFTSRTGSTLNAEFIEFQFHGSKVVLRKQDGSELTVSINDLSTQDQQWIRDELKRRRGK